MASIIKSFEISKNSDDLVYFVEDDYIHSDDSISEMVSVYDKFSTIFIKYFGCCLTADRT